MVERALPFGTLLRAHRLQPARIGREDHEEQAAFEARRLLDDGDLLQLRRDARQDGLAALRVVLQEQGVLP